MVRGEPTKLQAGDTISWWHEGRYLTFSRLGEPMTLNGDNKWELLGLRGDPIVIIILLLMGDDLVYSVERISHQARTIYTLLEGA